MRGLSRTRRALAGSRAGRIAGLALACLTAATGIGLALLWPYGGPPDFGARTVGAVEEAEVRSVGDRGCERFAGPGCRLIGFELRSGPDEGKESTVTLPGDEFAPDVDPGDRIRVARNAPPGGEGAPAGGVPLDDPSAQPFAFVDFERRMPLILLTAVFVVLVVVLGRRRGLFSLVGLGASLALLLVFVVPAILDGRPPLLVALVGSMAIMLVTIALAHGTGMKSVAAMLGTAVSLLLTALLALVGIELAHITGFASEESALLTSGSGVDISPGALVLAGFVIGALGVLDDVTVSQSSTVMALRRADPAQSVAQLFRRGLDVGRDHLSATVNTLVLAYAGVSLPILLIFSSQGTSFGDAVNREPVAEAIVGGLVGSIGLIAAVPLTTVLAALLSTGAESADLEADTHAH